MATAAGGQPSEWRSEFDTHETALPPITEDSLADIVEAHAGAAPPAPCMEYLGTSLTYADLDTWANRLANLLRQQGIRRGEVIGIHLPNIPQYIITMVAASKLGCVASGMSPLLAPAEVAHQIRDAGIRFLITLDALFNQTVVPNDGALPDLQAAIATNGQDLLAPGARTTGAEPAPTQQIGVLNFTAVANASDARVHEAVAMDEVVMIQYTGGTTGKPKGARLTQRNLQANAVQAETMVGYEVGNETFACVFPYYHAAGLFCCLMGLRQRARNLVIPDPRDLKAFCKAMQQFPPTFFCNVPTLYQMLLDEPEFRHVDFSQLKMALSGAGPMPVDIIPKIEAAIGTGKFCEAYGLTETSPMVTINPPGQTRHGTVGVPVPGTTAKIVDVETGATEMPADTSGELIVRGPQVFDGYLHLPDESARALREFQGQRWFYTGDVARKDDDGYITICDRSKDMLIVGGYKVFSVEVENKLKALDAIELSAVIGTPDTKRPGNDIVNLYVQLSEAGNARDPDQVRAEITAFCRDNMAAYKVPRQIHFVGAIPLTGVGKIDKKALRD